MSLFMLLYFVQMGMMKEHIRGPIRCCATLALDLLLQGRAEELVYNINFEPVDQNVIARGKEDAVGGNSPVRFHGKPCMHTDREIIRDLLRGVLDNLHEGGWEPDDYGHEDLVILEYTKCTIRLSTQFTLDWNSEHRAVADYFLYYTRPKKHRFVMNRDRHRHEEPEKPTKEMLESTFCPPPNFIHEMSDFYYHHYVGQVRISFVV